MEDVREEDVSSCMYTREAVEEAMFSFRTAALRSSGIQWQGMTVLVNGGVCQSLFSRSSSSYTCWAGPKWHSVWHAWFICRRIACTISRFCPSANLRVQQGQEDHRGGESVRSLLFRVTPRDCACSVVCALACLVATPPRFV